MNVIRLPSKLHRNDLMVRSLRIIRYKIRFAGSLGSWFTDKTDPNKDSSEPLMHHESSDLGS